MAGGIGNQYAVDQRHTYKVDNTVNPKLRYHTQLGIFRFNNRYKPIACPLKHVDKKDLGQLT